MSPAFKVAFAGGITAIAQIMRGEWPSAGLFYAVGIGGAALLLIQPAAPKAVDAFGSLILLTAVLVSGAEIAKAATNAINR